MAPAEKESFWAHTRGIVPAGTALIMAMGSALAQPAASASALVTPVAVSAQSRSSYGHEAGSKTVIRDPRVKTMLLGAHLLSLQWISWEHFGRAVVAEKKGLLTLTGEQRARTGSDYLRISGVITEVGRREFTFNGVIETRVSHLNNGESCKREGKMTFRITGSRKYWRLMQMKSPCDDVVDYVDIFFK